MGSIPANLIAALAAATISAGVVVGTSFLLAGPDLRQAVWNAAWISVAVAFAVALFSLLPIGLLLQRSGRFNLRTATLVGLALGAAIVALIAAINGSVAGLGSLLLLLSGAGGLGGLVYYLAFRGLGPNNSFKPKPLRGSA